MKYAAFFSFDLLVTSATSGGILDRAIEAEDKKHGDFLRLVFAFCFLVILYIFKYHMQNSSFRTHHEWCFSLWQLQCISYTLSYLLEQYVQEHVEGYLELSAKTKTYFITALALWDAEFYVKVDDDVHVNIGKLQVSFPF